MNKMYTTARNNNPFKTFKGLTFNVLNVLCSLENRLNIKNGVKQVLVVCLFLCCGLMQKGWGQTAPTYTLATTTGNTYTSISGTGTSESAVAADDAGVNITTLSPGFTFNGTTYTKAQMCSNGWVCLYTTAPTISTADGVYTPLSSGITNAAVLFAPYGADLTTSTAATTAAYFSQTGGVITFEWKNFSRYNGTAANDVLNFQVQLNTTTNTITYAYGTCTPGSNPTASPQVGFETSTTWSSAMNNLYINITGSPTTCDWSSAVTGNANTSNMYMTSTNTTVVPPSGLNYTWSTGTQAPVRTFSAPTSINTSGATLGWTAPTSATTYNVQYRIPGTCSWTN